MTDTTYVYRPPPFPYPRRRVLAALFGAGLVTFDATGSLALTGSAALGLDLAVEASGAIALTGTADLDLGSDELTAVGSLVLTGNASLAVEQSLAATGTVALTGTAALAIDYGWLPILGRRRSMVALQYECYAQPYPVAQQGVRILQIPAPTTLDVSAEGTITLTGSATLSVARGLAATGGIALTGAAGLTMVLGASASGSLVLTGTGSLARELGLGSDGSLVLTGTADLSVFGVADFSASGSIVLSGSASVALAVAYAATGPMVLTGSAALTVTGAGVAYTQVAVRTRLLVVARPLRTQAIT